MVCRDKVFVLWYGYFVAYANTDQSIYPCQDNDQARRFHGHCYRASSSLVNTLPAIPKTTGGEYKASCIISAYNAADGEAFLYVEFKDKIRQTQLEHYMRTMTATEVRFDTFSAKAKDKVSTYDDECGKTLFTLEKKSKEPGWTLVVVGTPSVEPKAPAEPSAAEFLAQEREDLVVQQRVMNEDPEAFQHDGGYGGPILGKQKLAERAEMPSSTGADEMKRPRIDVLDRLYAELGVLVQHRAAANELEKTKEENIVLEAKVDELTTEVNELEAGKEELTTKVNELEAGKEGLTTKINELEAGKEELTTKINELEARNNQLESKASTLIQVIKDVSKQKTNAMRATRAEVAAAMQVKDREIAELSSENTRLEQIIHRAVESLGGAGSSTLSNSWLLPDVYNNQARSKFVFRFLGPAPSTLWHALDALGNRELLHEMVGNYMYVYVYCGDPCTRTGIKEACAPALRAATKIEFISHHSRAASRNETFNPKTWTEAMFVYMINRLRTTPAM